jgi:hypothetical protein
LSEDDIGLPAFRAEMHQILGDEPSPWYLSYRVRFGIK